MTEALEREMTETLEREMTESLEREMTESLGRVQLGEALGDTARCRTGNGALAPGFYNPVNSNVAPNVEISGAWLERALRSDRWW